MLMIWSPPCSGELLCDAYIGSTMEYFPVQSVVKTQLRNSNNRRHELSTTRIMKGIIS